MKYSAYSYILHNRGLFFRQKYFYESRHICTGNVVFSGLDLSHPHGSWSQPPPRVWVSATPMGLGLGHPHGAGPQVGLGLRHPNGAGSQPPPWGWVSATPMGLYLSHPMGLSIGHPHGTGSRPPPRARDLVIKW